jgi:hypothetical protein
VSHFFILPLDYSRYLRHFLTLSFLLFSLAIWLPCHGQDHENSHAYGVVCPREWELTRCTFDTAAQILIIFDVAEVTKRENDYRHFLYRRHLRAKILKREGIQRWPDFRLTVERTADIRLQAMIMSNEAGVLKQYPLDNNTILKKRLNKYYDEIFVLAPNLKEGSIIDIAFTYEDQNHPMTIPSWRFQDDFPVLWSEYSVTDPSHFIPSDIFGLYKPFISETKQGGIYRHWVMKNIPAFREEPLMLAPATFVSAVRFYPRSTSWDKIADDLRNYSFFGLVRDHNTTYFLNRIVGDITANVSDTLAKIERISQYIKDHVEWNGISDYATFGLRNTLKEGKGTSGDINLLLAAMLIKAGIKTDFILISTRENGIIRKEYPSGLQCNYALCLVTVNKKNILLDATDKLLPFNVIPERCLNDEGLRVAENNATWIKLVSNIRSKIIYNGELAITPDGTLNGNLTVVFDGYKAHDIREKYGQRGQQEWIEELAKEQLQDVTKIEVENFSEDIQKPIRLRQAVIIKDHVSALGNILYVTPFVEAKENINPFINNNQERQYPIDLGTAIDKRYVTTFVVPEDYEIESVPKNQIYLLQGKAAQYSFSASIAGNKLTIVSNLIFNQTQYPAEQFQELREFYNLIIAKQAEQIVLRRKK